MKPKVKVYTDKNGEIYLWVAYKEKWFDGYFYIPEMKLWMASADNPKNLNLEYVGVL